jgi:hypothetical protein
LGTPRQHFSVFVHEKLMESLEDSPPSETSLREGLSTGMIAGGTLGLALGGLVLGPLGLAGAGALATAVFAGTAGVGWGGVFGAIAGASGPDPVFEEWEKELKDGKVLLTIEAPDRPGEDDAEKIVAKLGGRSAKKPLFWPLRKQKN